MATYALNAYEDWPKVRDLLIDMKKRGEVDIDYGSWMSPIWIRFDDAYIQSQFLTLCKENGVAYRRDDSR